MKEYKVKNVSKADIVLGELNIKIPVGKTMNLLMMRPHLTEYRLLEQEAKGTLGIRLKQGMLMKLEESNVSEQVLPKAVKGTKVSEQKMKIINKPTVFEEKAKSIIYPNKVDRGIVMDHETPMLDAEIIEEVVSSNYNAVVEPVVGNSAVTMNEVKIEKEEEAVETLKVFIVDNDVVSMVPDGEEKELKIIDGSIKTKEPELKSVLKNTGKKGSPKKTPIENKELQNDEVSKLKIENKKVKRIEDEVIENSSDVVRERQSLVDNTTKFVSFGDGVIAVKDEVSNTESQKELNSFKSAEIIMNGETVAIVTKDTNEMRRVEKDSFEKISEVNTVEKANAERVKKILEQTKERIKEETKEQVEQVKEKASEMEKTQICKATNRFGKPCRGKVKEGADYCIVHAMQNKKEE